MAVKSSFKNMVLCLLAICFVCSALLAGVNVLTREPIERGRLAKTEKAVAAVLPPCNIVSERQEIELDGVSYGYYAARQDDEFVGCAIESSTIGFGGVLSLMVGIAADGTISGTQVLSHSETPGLGAKCSDPAFSDQFKGWDSSVKKLAVRSSGGDVDAITASTITSRAYTLAVANAVRAFRDIDAVLNPDASADGDAGEQNEINEGGLTNE